MKLKFICQYISLNQEVQKILQILKKCPKACIVPVLDIEDSLQIPLDPEKTTLLKSRARVTLQSLLKLVNEMDLEMDICIRINATDTEEFSKDILMLEELAPLINWTGIYLPKVHSEEVLALYINSLRKVNYSELVVIAESQGFFDNYPGIISLCKSKDINKIQFGHWDYFLDVKEFPIPLPNDIKLWNRVESLIKAAEKDDMLYIHSPFCFLMKHDDFQSITAYLDKITTLAFGMSTLSFSQALAICKNVDNTKPVNPVRYNYKPGEKVKIAEDLVQFFNRPVSPEYSFNIDTSNYRFYAPHEYLSALEFLNNPEAL